MSKDLTVLERFRFLHNHWNRRPAGNLPKGQELERIERRMVQIELFYLAQIIGLQHAPDIQRELDAARKRVMEEIKKQELPIGEQMLPSRDRSRPFPRWFDFQITPEVSADPTITGVIVSRANAVRLRRALKAQIKAVMEVVNGI